MTYSLRELRTVISLRLWLYIEINSGRIMFIHRALAVAPHAVKRIVTMW
jgi:hypothetical protein